MKQIPTLRERLNARNTTRVDVPEATLVPASGRIDTETVARIHELASIARSGDVGARDQLWISLQPRLDRTSWVLKPWPNTRGMSGIWERDDVLQESWIVFAELLAIWDGTVDFIPYLLSRFPWRLRDRIMRGIGKRQTQYGETRIPEAMLTNMLVASDGEQPESVSIARKLLEELLRRSMTGAGAPGEFEAWLRLINTRSLKTLVSPNKPLEEPSSATENRTG